jgi:geranylgeranyl diphosphate synthase type II
MNKRWLDEIERAIQQLELPSEPRSLYNPFQYTMGMGGKRIRPYLTLFTITMQCMQLLR